jgi:hypothetical protein
VAADTQSTARPNSDKAAASLAAKQISPYPATSPTNAPLGVRANSDRQANSMAGQDTSPFPVVTVPEMPRLSTLADKDKKSAATNSASPFPVVSMAAVPQLPAHAKNDKELALPVVPPLPVVVAATTVSSQPAGPVVGMMEEWKPAAPSPAPKLAAPPPIVRKAPHLPQPEPAPAISAPTPVAVVGVMEEWRPVAPSAAAQSAGRDSALKVIPPSAATKAPDQGYETTGLVYMIDEPATGASTSKLSTTAVKSAIERTCGSRITNVQVKLDPDNKVMVSFTAPNSADGSNFQDRILKLPELGPYTVNMRITLQN